MKRVSEVPIRDAASVVLARDGSAGIEVLMLRRSLELIFASGAHVFPGGAVDASDSSPSSYERCRGLDDAAASSTLGIERDGLSFWVAAIRECFEEAGVLLAVDAAGEPAVLDDLAGERRMIETGELAIDALCRERGLWMATDCVHYVSHWITPPGAPRRYDTRFFVAAAPADQVAAHDEHETVDSGWIRPADALDRYERGEWDLILPTQRNLALLSEFRTVGALMAATAPVAPGDDVRPMVPDSGGFRIELPSDRLMRGAG